MKKHQLLKKAFEDYPEGTTFLQLKSKTEILSSGKFSVIMGNGCFGITDDINSNGVYSSVKKEWAEIVKPKIAVKVENEKEFKALMKYYDSLGYVWNGGDKATIKKELQKYPNYIGFEDKFQHSIENTKEWETIHFSDFAKDKGIKLPLYVSEQGNEFFEGSKCFWIYKNTSGDFITGVNCSFSKCHINMIERTKEKECQTPFPDEQSALDWIEAQKPKTIEYVSNFGIKCQSSKDEVLLNCGCGCFSLTKKDIESIHKSMQELS